MDRYFEDILGRTDVTYRAEFMSKEDVLKEKIYSLEKQLAEERIKIKEVKLPKHYIINENATILFWDNGEKTIVKKCAEDEFNPRLAYLTAFFQHYVDISKNKANKYLASLQVEEIKETKQNPKSKKRKKFKFKVGDKVIDNFGKQVTILKIDNDETVLPYLIKDSEGYQFWYSEDQLIKEDK